MSPCFHRGSAIAKIVGANAAKYDKFDTTVNMWVFEEMVNDRKLSEIINTDHENVKYLPGHKLPANVVSLKRKPCICQPVAPAHGQKIY